MRRRNLGALGLTVVAALFLAQLLPGQAAKTPAPTEAKKGRPASRKAETDPGGLAYVWIPPGTFMMGCSPGDSECSGGEKPAHGVTISRGFWMGQTEVTVGAYKQYTRATNRAMPSQPTGRQRRGEAV